jgi:hypothetical protein
VAKSALGRSLGKLLKEANGGSRAPQAGQEDLPLSPGMATLLKAGNGGAKADQPTSTEAKENPDVPEAKDWKKLVKPSLVIADVLLLFLAARLVFRSGGHFGVVEILLCVAAAGLGAWLSCLAIWRE